MTFSKREKTIGIVVGGLLALLILYQVIISPYLAALADVDKQTKAAMETIASNKEITDKQARLAKLWAVFKNNVKTDDSAAEAQVSRAAVDWALNAGINVTSVKQERTTAANQFQVIGFHISGVGSTPAIARMMWAFETADIPVRVEELTLSPLREGTDNLKVELTFSTLSQKPSGDADTHTAVSDAGNISEVRSWNE